MAWFRRRGARSTEHPITAFWAWWANAGATISPHEAAGSAEELTTRVTAIHQDLTWHFSKGRSAQHRLTVTSGGLAEARPSAERWLRAAPAADSVWEFRSSQEADPEALTSVLEIAGVQLDLTRARFRIEPVDHELRVHVGVFHPDFATIPDKARARVSYLILDWLLGDDDVERWIGHVEPLAIPPQHVGTFDELAAAVTTTAACRDPDTWVLARGNDKHGTPFMATWRRGVRWLDAPTFDHHHTIVVPFKQRADGLPADSSVLPWLGRIEDELENVLGSRGLIVALMTREGVRSFHVYTDGEDQNIDDAIAQWARKHNFTASAQPDPSWQQVRVFTG